MPINISCHARDNTAWRADNGSSNTHVSSCVAGGFPARIRFQQLVGQIIAQLEAFKVVPCDVEVAIEVRRSPEFVGSIVVFEPAIVCDARFAVAEIEAIAWKICAEYPENRLKIAYQLVQPCLRAA